MKNEKAKRFNKGKTRYELVSAEGLRNLADVYTKGAHKYTLYRTPDGKEVWGEHCSVEDAKKYEVLDSGADNWRKGQSWMDALGSVKRHIASFEAGEDFDPELGTLHLGNAAWGLFQLMDYYKSHPETDDRHLWFKKPFKRVWLDIDGILADFESFFLSYLGLPRHHPTDWNDYRFREEFHRIENDDRFWSEIPRIVDPQELRYPITGYITSRPCFNLTIELWFEKMGYPKAELINIWGTGNKKSDFLKGNCDVMVDDSIQNFVEMQNQGVLCYLMTRPHNAKYDVGHYRVNSLKEFFDKIR